MQVQNDLRPVIEAKSGEQVSAVKTYLEAHNVIAQTDLNSCFKALTYHHISQIDPGKSIMNRECFSSIQTVWNAGWMLMGFYSPSFFVEKGYLQKDFSNVTKLVLESADNLAEITHLFPEVETLVINELNSKDVETLNAKWTKLTSFECHHANITQDDVRNLIMKNSSIKSLTLKNCIAIDQEYRRTLACRGISVTQVLPQGYQMDYNGKIWKSSEIPQDLKKCN